MITRRTLSLSALCLPPALVQGQAPRVPRVGLITTFPGPAFATFRDGLAEAARTEGRAIALEARFHEAVPGRIPQLAAELLAQGVEAIVAVGGFAVRAIRDVARDIPILFAATADPVTTGLVQDARRPGGTVTGVTTDDPGLPAAHVQLLRDLVPGLERIAILREAGLLEAVPARYRAAAEQAGLRPAFVSLRGPEPDLDAAFAELRLGDAQALIGLEEPVISLRARRIAEMAAAARLPLVYGRDWAGLGPLAGYGTSLAAGMRELVGMVTRVLRGEQPGELPVMTVNRRELVINLAVARTVGLNVPPAVLARATRAAE